MNDIDPKLQARMVEMANMFSAAFHPLGFCLLVFHFGEGGSMNYLSNANREDMIASLKELLANMEHRAPPSTDTLQ